MASIIRRLLKQELIHPPDFLSDNLQYECFMGSTVYGCANDNSDLDIYGWCIPRKEIVFPNLAGSILGFDEPHNFDVWQQHHIKETSTQKEYDCQVYSIIKYFKLCMDCNPNIIDSLFVARRHILHISQIGEMVREKRDLFLHKGAWPRFKGYSCSQLNSISKPNQDNDVQKIQSIEQKYSLQDISISDIELELKDRKLTIN